MFLCLQEHLRRRWAKPVTHVQVEYQGVRSDPIEIPIVATGPGLFYRKREWNGPGLHSQRRWCDEELRIGPAMPGSVIILYGTGEGLTDPRGVDGRLAIDVLPKPVAAVSVEIGGLPAAVEYAGAAPYTMPGMVQINATMSSNVASGDHIPVVAKIGGRVSQDGVTVAVR